MIVKGRFVKLNHPRAVHWLSQVVLLCFLEETPFVMCPWVCQRSPATNSGVAVGSSAYFMESCGNSVVSSKPILVMCPPRGDGVALIPVLLHPKQCSGDLGTAGMSLGPGWGTPLELS